MTRIAPFSIEQPYRKGKKWTLLYGFGRKGKKQSYKPKLLPLPTRIIARSTAMYSDHFWLGLAGIAAPFYGNSQRSEETLTQYEKEWLKFPKAERDEFSEQLVNAIGALSRLKMRLAEHDETEFEISRKAK